MDSDSANESVPITRFLSVGKPFITVNIRFYLAVQWMHCGNCVILH